MPSAKISSDYTHRYRGDLIFGSLLRREPIFAAALIAFASLLAYGPFIPFLGFYWDDWSLTFIYHTQGVGGLFPFFTADRPFQAVVDGAAFLLNGENPALWHVYAFALRLAGGWALLWLLRGLWPHQRFATTAAALLFVVYPGFVQQSIGLTYSSHFLTLLLAIASIALTVRTGAPSSSRRYIAMTLLSMLLCATYLWALEFFIGLEAVRLLLTAYIVVQQRPDWPVRQRVSECLWRSLPCLLVTAIFLFWRVFFFTGDRVETDIGFALSRYTNGGLSTLLTLPLELIRRFITVTVLAWVNIFPITGASLAAFLLALGVALAAAGGVLAYQGWLKRHETHIVDEAAESKWAKPALMIGVLSVLAGLLLPVAVNRYPILNDAYDRYTLGAMIGAALIVVGFVYTYVKAGRALLIAGLVALAIVIQFHAGNTYRAHWVVQQNMWWQLAWRAPGLEQGTVLIFNHTPPKFLVPVVGDAITSPAQIIYSSTSTELQFGGIHLYDAALNNVYDGLQNGSDFSGGWDWRGIPFEGSYLDSLIVYYDGLSCLRVIDPQRLELPQSGVMLMDGFAPYSRLEQIRTQDAGVSPPQTLFGPQPPHTWCYYFQKADLARQRGDWDEVARLGDEARQMGYTALDTSEWLVFVEGYLSVGRVDAAGALIEEMVSDDSVKAFILPQVCDLLERVSVSSDEGGMTDIQAALDCGALPLILSR